MRNRAFSQEFIGGWSRVDATGFAHFASIWALFLDLSAIRLMWFYPLSGVQALPA
jgi:hypothetical protein